MALSVNEVIRNSERRETKPHGSVSFPCAGYEYEMKELMRDEVPWHWHDELEAVYIVDGTMNLGVISNHIKIHTGEAALINSNALHSATASGHCALRSFVFSSLLVSGGDSSVFSDKYVLPLCRCGSFTVLKFDSDDESIKGFSDAFDRLKNDSLGYEFSVRELLSRIVFAAYRKFRKEIEDENPPPNIDAIRISNMLKFIHLNYHENITLSDISQSANVGEREALRCFKRTIGESPIHCLMKYRLMKGADFLKENPDEGIAVIAGKCGFDSPSYFTKKFHELYGKTPREYIEMNRERTN